MPESNGQLILTVNLPGDRIRARYYSPQQELKVLVFNDEEDATTFASEHNLEVRDARHTCEEC